MTDEKITIGVYPEEAFTKRKRLFDALEVAFGICFTGCHAGAREGLSGCVHLGDHSCITPENCLPPNLPVFESFCMQSPAQSDTQVVFGKGATLDSRLHGRHLRDECAASTGALELAPGDEVLAHFDNAPGWVKSHAGDRIIDRVASPLAELGEREGLRDKLRVGSFLGLLPLVHWLREILASEGWSPPPLRACFLFDDPNLHASSFGYIDYAALVEHAGRHNYHAAIATVPLDAWLARECASRIFRENPSRLSLLIHGNDHVSHELARPQSDCEAQMLLAQALHRIANLEKRAGVSVSRVMAAPHGRCAEVSMRQLALLGYEAACISRPYPWLELPQAEHPLVQWHATDLVANGAVVISRYQIGNVKDDVVFRAFLDQPLVIYGHHGDLRDGLAPLAEWAASINSLGDVRWESLESISRSSYYVRREGEVLRVVPLARRLAIELPDDIRRVRLEKAPWWPNIDGQTVTCGPRQELLAIQPEFDVSPLDTNVLDVDLRHPLFVDPNSIPAPPVRLWPIVRRLLTEGRDRFQARLGK